MGLVPVSFQMVLLFRCSLYESWFLHHKSRQHATLVGNMHHLVGNMDHKSRQHATQVGNMITSRQHASQVGNMIQTQFCRISTFSVSEHLHQAHRRQASPDQQVHASRGPERVLKAAHYKGRISGRPGSTRDGGSTRTKPDEAGQRKREGGDQKDDCKTDQCHQIRNGSISIRWRGLPTSTPSPQFSSWWHAPFSLPGHGALIQWSSRDGGHW